MSGAMIDVVEKKRITVCDICGGPIPDEDLKDFDAVGYVLGKPYENMATAKTTDKVHKFRWPGNKRREQFQKEAAAAGQTFLSRYSGPQRERNYDFHADCLLNLVEAAIAHRVALEEKAAVVAE